MKKLQEADSTWDLSFAISGEDALAKLKAAKFAFDVVFVDENLSISDGLFGHELVQVMRESFHMKSTIIIACTSNPAKVCCMLGFSRSCGSLRLRCSYIYVMAYFIALVP